MTSKNYQTNLYPQNAWIPHEIPVKNLPNIGPQTNKGFVGFRDKEGDIPGRFMDVRGAFHLFTTMENFETFITGVS